VKDEQGLLRHSRTATTTDVYMQQLPEGVRATVNSIYQELTQKSGGTGDGGPGPSRPSVKRAKVLSFSTRKPVRQAAVEKGKSEAVFCRPLKICCLAGLLVDPIGIEPMTSSMPFRQHRATH
jgi:hypothetical protein